MILRSAAATGNRGWWPAKIVEPVAGALLPAAIVRGWLVNQRLSRLMIVAFRYEREGLIV